METILSRKRELGDCVELQRRERPGSTGKLLMSWLIRTDGTTSNVAPSEEFVGTPIATCVTAVIESMKFPPYEPQGDPITFPFKF